MSSACPPVATVIIMCVMIVCVCVRWLIQNRRRCVSSWPRRRRRLRRSQRRAPPACTRGARPRLQPNASCPRSPRRSVHVRRRSVRPPRDHSVPAAN